MQDGRPDVPAGSFIRGNIFDDRFELGIEAVMIDEDIFGHDIPGREANLMPRDIRDASNLVTDSNVRIETEREAPVAVIQRARRQLYYAIHDPDGIEKIQRSADHFELEQLFTSQRVDALTDDRARLYSMQLHEALDSGSVSSHAGGCNQTGFGNRPQDQPELRTR